MWTFRFIPEQHHNGSKTLFKGTKHQHRIRANQRGVNGVRDAISVIDKMVTHPSTSEFICQKLINKFVSDEISLTTYHSRTAPPELLTLMDRAIEAWHATKPAGNIDKVMRSAKTAVQFLAGHRVSGQDQDTHRVYQQLHPCA